MKPYHKILSNLNIETKLQLTHGKSNWTFFGVAELGYPELMCGDGPHGLRAYTVHPKDALFDHNSYAPTTLFPVAAAMAATFQPDLIEQVGKAIGEECNMHQVDLLLAPGLNLKRSPLGGRNFEYYSEDPYLTGVCGAAFVTGVQSTGVGACVKHFALNEQEHQRRFIDTSIDDFTLFEHYLRPFHYAIQKAHPWAVMTAYNRVRGDYAGESKLLQQDILRTMWNYDGLVLSDWGGVQHKVKSVKNGMNLEMPGPSEFHWELQEAIAKGELTEEDVDQSLIPLFRFYDRVKDNPNKGNTTDLNVHHKLAQQVAREAIVLLENDGILPLEPHTKLAVIGEYADKPRINGGGSASLKPHTIESPLVELDKYFDVSYAQGYHDDQTSKDELSKVKDVVLGSDVALFFTGTSSDSEGRDRSDIQIPTSHLDVLNTVLELGKPVIVILNSGSAVDVSPFVDRVHALIEAWLLGGANAVALVDILRGEVNPSGRLSETFPMNLKQTPHYGLFPGRQDEVSYHLDVLRNGYRYYDLHDITPRYPFGYGLSYTTFDYQSIHVDKTQYIGDEPVSVSVTITNTGQRVGQETIQLYVGATNSFYPRPVKELKQFRKVKLNPGETTTVVFDLDVDSFAVYHPNLSEYRVEEGRYSILVGTNVSDTPLAVEIERIQDVKTPSGLTLHHPMGLFKKKRKDVVSMLEVEVGKIPWYHMEEPAERVMRRIKRHQNWSDETHQYWIELLVGQPTKINNETCFENFENLI